MKKRSVTPQKDDFLSGLIRKSNLEKPDPSFTLSVMERIERIEDPISDKKSLGSLLKVILPWFLFLLIGFGMTYLTFWMNETASADSMVYMNSLIAYIGDSFRQFFNLFSSKFAIIGLMVFVCGILFFIIDRMLSRPKKIENQYLF